MMAEKYAPKLLPERVEYEEPDGLRISTPYKVIRLWEIDPAAAFEPDGAPLLPWVPLLKGGAAEFERAAQAIEDMVEHPRPPYEPAVMLNHKLRWRPFGTIRMRSDSFCNAWRRRL